MLSSVVECSVEFWRLSLVASSRDALGLGGLVELWYVVACSVRFCFGGCDEFR